MTTQSQIRANRKNARKSTGPKTPEGKAKVAQNATKHGLTASTDVIRGESQEEFDAHRQGFLDALAPRNAVEDFLADHLASLAWRLKRANRMQNQILDGMMLDMPFVLKYRGCLYEEPSNHDPDLTLGAAINRDFRFKRIIERFMLYERRLQNCFTKCLNDLNHQKRKNPSSRVGLAPPSQSDNPRPRGSGAKKQTQSTPSMVNSVSSRASEASRGISASTAGNPAKQSQSCDYDTATSMNTELYNLCSHTGRAQSKPNSNLSNAPQNRRNVTYKTTTRRY